MKKVLKRIGLIIGIIAVLTLIGGVSYGLYKKATLDIPNPVATIEVENFGTITVELYPDKAPNTVANFIRLANRGYYNGSTFHRTIPDFVIQGGSDPEDSTASPYLSDIMDDISEDEDEEYNIEGEFIANGFNDNNIKHEAGVISMARADYTSYSSSLTTESYNSAGAQFFIMTADNSSLDGLYAAFGKVIDGMDVVEEISNVEVYYRDDELEDDDEIPTDEDGNEIDSDTPVEDVVITSISVETYGIDYGIPETVEVFDAYSWLLYQYYGYSYSY